MKTTLTALSAAATLAAATTASFGAGSVSVTGAIVVSAATDAPAYLAAPAPGYILYSGYAAALPSPTCYWTRMPIYDSDRNVIGWRGRPVGVCPRVSAHAE
jgi:hypothetical protein